MERKDGWVMALTKEQMEKAVRAYEKMQESGKRYTAKVAILLEKAKKAGITCSEAEIDARLKEKAKAK